MSSGAEAKTVTAPASAVEVVSLSKAAGWLPMRYGDARGWLRRQGLVADIDGRPVVVWGDVLERIRELATGGRKPREAAPMRPSARGLRRATF